jgi:hypothetical protein
MSELEEICAGTEEQHRREGVVVMNDAIALEISLWPM